MTRVIVDDQNVDAHERDRLARLFAIADDAIDAGFDVLPAAVWAKPDGTLDKAPLLVHGHLQAHRDKQLIRQQLIHPPHFPKGVPEVYEVVVGFVPGSGGCGVLDADMKNGKLGAQTLRELVNEHGNFVGAEWRSPSGGTNVLFRKPPGTSYGNRSPWKDQGIDVRVDAGWAVAPGNCSVVGAWTWIGASGYGTAKALPDAITAQLTPTNGQYQTRATNAETVAFIEASPTTSAPAAATAFSDQLAQFRAAGTGSRHAALLHIAGWAFGMGALDLRNAVAQIKDVWQDLTAGEDRDDVHRLLPWVVAQEMKQRAGVRVASGASTSAPIVVARNLPDAFWEARPHLTALRAWAHSRMRSADAVLASVRARYAVLSPHTLRVDTGIADPMSLNAAVAIVGKSGAGKTTSAALGANLVPLDLRTDIYEGPIGSGEGVIEAFYEWRPNPNGKGKVRVQTKTAALLRLDEGEALTRMAERSGTTILPTLRSAYSGEMLGQTNAKQENRRVLKAHSYRLVVLVGLQAAAAAQLLADVATGTPQRVVMFNANDPTIPDVPTEAPAPWTSLPVVALISNAPHLMRLTPEVQREVQARALAVQRGELDLDPLDSHRDQNRIKEAAMLALLDGQRLAINAEDWKLAGMILDTSDALRRWVIEQNQAAATEAENRRNAVGVRRHQALAADDHERAVLGGAKAMARLVRRVDGPVPRRKLTQATAGSHREHADIEEMIERAEAMDWLRPEADGYWVAGGSVPT